MIHSIELFVTYFTLRSKCGIRYFCHIACVFTKPIMDCNFHKLVEHFFVNVFKTIYSFKDNTKQHLWKGIANTKKLNKIITHTELQ